MCFSLSARVRLRPFGDGECVITLTAVWEVMCIYDLMSYLQLHGLGSLLH